jgi:hypothetical protein
LRNFLLLLVLAICIGLSWRIHQIGQQRHTLRVDQAEIMHITYGMFDPSQWKVMISAIMEMKISEFELSGENRREVRKRAIDLMNGLLTQVEEVMRRSNKEKGAGGAIKQGLFNFLVDLDAVREGIPGYADRMVAYVNAPKNRDEMRRFAVAKLEEIGETTEGVVNDSLLAHTVAHYCNMTATLEADEVIAVKMDRADRELDQLYTGLGLGVLSLLLVALLAQKGDRMQLGILIAVGICLLLLGLTLPMIDIEARVAHFELVLLGETVAFDDQVLFHQSKSILDVVRVLFAERKPELMLVAALVFSFSVLVPAAKMLLSMFTLARGREIGGRLPSFLMYRAGKWSMADVMVVAIFMSFIGFNGVVNSQLATLEEHAGEVHVLTTNNSSLEVGFYMFTAYCVIGLISSALLKRALSVKEVQMKEKQVTPL